MTGFALIYIFPCITVIAFFPSLVKCFSYVTVSVFSCSSVSTFSQEPQLTHAFFLSLTPLCTPLSILSCFLFFFYVSFSFSNCIFSTSENT